MKKEFIELINDNLFSINFICHLTLMSKDELTNYQLNNLDFEDIKSVIPSINEKTFNKYDGKIIELFYKYNLFDFLVCCDISVPEFYELNSDGFIKDFSEVMLEYKVCIHVKSSIELLEKIKLKKNELIDTRIKEIGHERLSQYTYKKLLNYAKKKKIIQ